MQNPNPVSQSTTATALYFVRSDKRPHVFYTVAAIDNRCACGQRIAGLLHCQCADHINRAHDCKHVERVLRGEIAPATLKALPATAEIPQFDASDLYGDAGQGIRRSLQAVS